MTGTWEPSQLLPFQVALVIVFITEIENKLEQSQKVLYKQLVKFDLVVNTCTHAHLPAPNTHPTVPMLGASTLVCLLTWVMQGEY